MEQLIIDIKRVENCKNAIPIIKQMLQSGSFYYVAGSLILSGTPDHLHAAPFLSLLVEPINDTKSDIIREAQYLISLMYIRHKKGCHYYDLALENVKLYEEEVGAVSALN